MAQWVIDANTRKQIRTQELKDVQIADPVPALGVYLASEPR